MKTRALLLAGLGLLVVSWSASAHDELLKLAGTSGFVDMLVQKHGFGRVQVEAALAPLHVNDKAIRLLTHAKDGGRKVWWDEYRARHLGSANVRAGAHFYREHATALVAAEQRFGVPSAIIAAIIGVETRYGAYIGKYQTLEVLATLAFAFPSRAEYFTKELEQLFLYAREQDLTLAKLQGSYAGAFGYGQFMPTSARNWAVDMNSDGVANLFDYSDAIGSVANFLAEHGWQRGVPMSFAVEVQKGAQPQVLLDVGIIPSLFAQEFTAAGLPVQFAAGEAYTGLLALVDLVNETSVEYRAGTINYYVLTRYNRSNKYAIAVLDLARGIEATI